MGSPMKACSLSPPITGGAGVSVAGLHGTHKVMRFLLSGPAGVSSRRVGLRGFCRGPRLRFWPPESAFVSVVPSRPSTVVWFVRVSSSDGVCSVLLFAEGGVIGVPVGALFSNTSCWSRITLRPRIILYGKFFKTFNSVIKLCLYYYISSAVSEHIVSNISNLLSLVLLNIIYLFSFSCFIKNMNIIQFHNKIIYKYY
jgi:hypothetical protein